MQGAGGVRAALVAHYEAWAARLGGDAFGKLSSLKAGDPVVFQRWQIPDPWRSGAPGGPYDPVRVEPDGSLTVVRPLIFYGRHLIRGTWYGNKHAVDYVPVGAGGDRSDIVIELAEVVGRVDDPENWTTGRNDPQPPPNAA